MVSTIITHLIGVAALIAILTMIIMYTGFMTQTMFYNNIKSNLEYVSQMIALQLKYGITSGTNTTLTLDYPVVIGKNIYYNVYIGNGSVLSEKIPILTGKLSPLSIYVVAATPSNSIYAYTRVCNTTYDEKQVIVANGYIIFGSGTITRISITRTRTNIAITIKEILVRVS